MRGETVLGDRERTHGMVSFVDNGKAALSDVVDYDIRFDFRIFLACARRGAFCSRTRRPSRRRGHCSLNRMRS
jgi:hypothetical protein